jgi:hypothetical protein
MHPLVHIVVLNWNGFEDTLRCVGSLERQTYPNFRIIVVDNGSIDGSLNALSALGERITLTVLPENLGYTGGNNFAMRAAFGSGAEYVWLFNSDAEADPNALAGIVAVCEADPAVGLASPLVLEADDHHAVQFGCGVFDLDIPQYRPSYDVDQARAWQTEFPDRIALHGTALLIRHALYQAIGGLDDHFFAYWEDIDYSIRSAIAGFRNIAVLDTAIYHDSKPTRAAPETIKPHYYYFYSRNELLMWRKFCSGRKYLRAVAWILQRQLRQIARMPGNTAGIDAILAGLWHGLTSVGGRYDDARRMPWPLSAVLRRYPGFWIRLLGGRPDQPVA